MRRSDSPLTMISLRVQRTRGALRGRAETGLEPVVVVEERRAAGRDGVLQGDHGVRVRGRAGTLARRAGRDRGRVREDGARHRQAPGGARRPGRRREVEEDAAGVAVEVGAERVLRVDRVVQRLGERVQLRGVARSRSPSLSRFWYASSSPCSAPPREGAGRELRVDLGARDRRRAAGRRHHREAAHDHRRAVLVVVGDTRDVRELRQVVEQQVAAVEQVVRRLARLHDLHRRRVELRRRPAPAAPIWPFRSEICAGSRWRCVMSASISVSSFARICVNVVEAWLNAPASDCAGLRQRLAGRQRLRVVGDVVPGVEEVLRQRLQAVVATAPGSPARSRAARGSGRRAEPLVGHRAAQLHVVEDVADAAVASRP